MITLKTFRVNCFLGLGHNQQNKKNIIDPLPPPTLSANYPLPISKWNNKYCQYYQGSHISCLNLMWLTMCNWRVYFVLTKVYVWLEYTLTWLWIAQIPETLKHSLNLITKINFEVFCFSYIIDHTHRASPNRVLNKLFGQIWNNFLKLSNLDKSEDNQSCACR